MTVLVLVEPSHRGGSVAISKGDSIVRSLAGNDSRDDVFHQMPTLMKQVESEFGKPSGIVFGKGPGSFTGLRVGAALCFGLAVGYHIPLLPVCSFAAVVYGSNARNGIVVSDARRGEYFFSSFRDSKTTVPQIISDDELGRIIKALDGEAVLRPRFFVVEGPSEVGGRAFEPAISWLSSGLLRAARMRPKDAWIPPDVERLSMFVPNYLRSVSAQTLEERAQERNLAG